jgi:hypothetical protein
MSRPCLTPSLGGHGALFGTLSKESGKFYRSPEIVAFIMVNLLIAVGR